MKTRLGALALLPLALVLAFSGVVAAHDPLADKDVAAVKGLHGDVNGHLIGTGDWGDLNLIGQLEVSGAHDDLVADVAVSPDGMTAYLANWGEDDCAGPETGGQNSPDAGAWIVDISDLANPEEIGFIPSHQDTRPGEGMHVVNITTKSFSGDVLVMNNEQCGKNGKGGVSLWDVTDPTNPTRLSENFGDRSGVRADTNSTHSAFAWDAGAKAYIVMQDSSEFPDVDILDITNPKRPRLIAEYNLNDYDVDQPALGLTDSDLHDMTVKLIDGKYILLASYWDGGYVMLDVTDPTTPIFLGDTEYANIDPELADPANTMVPAESRTLTPEGNGHQAEFTIDNEFFIATDEDFGPYRAGDFKITSGPHLGTYPSVIVPGGQAPAILPDLTLNGPTVYGGYGCPTSAPIPTPESIPGYVASLLPGEEKIIVLQRGPTGDPSASEEACFPGEKAHEAELAGWDAVLFVNRHVAAANETFCGSGAFVDSIVAICTSHEAFHRLFDTPPFAQPFTYPDGPAIGTIGADIQVGSKFDGWGYVHLYDRQTLEEIDTFSIPEAMDPAYASGFGDLSVHEVATDPLDPSRAYLSYYSGGVRMIEIQCSNPADEKTCELVEVGGYLGAEGNDVWGVEAFVRDGETYVLASDRDYGLLIFETLNDN